MSINQSSLFFRKKTNNKKHLFQGGQLTDKGLEDFFKLARNAVVSQEEIGHGLVEIESYLGQLRFQQAEIKAKLQLGEACQRMLKSAWDKSKISGEELSV